MRYVAVALTAAILAGCAIVDIGQATHREWSRDGIKWLRDVIEGAAPQRVAREVFIRIPSEHDDRNVGADLT